MQRKKIIVLFIITILLVNIALAYATDSMNKTKEDENTVEKEQMNAGNETQGESYNDTMNDSETQDANETQIIEPEPASENYSLPYELHGPGKGNITKGQEWSGDVWAHYDYNVDFGLWEVGIEGLTHEGETEWYVWELVDNETFKNNTLKASAVFIDEPFNVSEFVYEADLNSMKWSITGEGFNFSGDIVYISFREPINLPSQDYSSSVDWRNTTWNSETESIRVTFEDYLESKILDGESTYWGEAYAYLPEEFCSASSQWIKTSFIDEGNNQPEVGLGLRNSDYSLYVGGVELADGEESWFGDHPNYIIYYKIDDQGYEFIDTEIPRDHGEHTIHLIRNEDQSLDCWVDWCYITSIPEFDSELFRKISLLGNHDSDEDTVVFTDFEYGIGSPYMDMPVDVDFVGVLDTFYCDPDVKIVESMWYVSIEEDGTAYFQCTFTELNIQEDAVGDIVGGYDYFVISMSGDYWIDRLDGIYVFSGTMTWMKNGKPLSTQETIVYVHPDDYGNQLVLDWDPDGWMFGSLLPR